MTPPSHHLTHQTTTAHRLGDTQAAMVAVMTATMEMTVTEEAGDTRFLPQTHMATRSTHMVLSARGEPSRHSKSSPPSPRRLTP